MRTPGPAHVPLLSRLGVSRVPVAAASLVLAALVALVALVAPATAARAHDVMVGSDPAEGAVVDVPPGQVVVSFSAEQMDLGAALAVTDPDGEDRVVEGPVVDGRDVRAELDGGGPAGEWTVTWRSVSSDGHPISGEYTFTVAGDAGQADAGGGEEPADDEPAATTQDEPVDEPVAPEATAVAEGTEEPGADEADDDGGPHPALVVALALGAVAAAAIVLLMVRRLGPGPDAGPGGPRGSSDRDDV